MFLIECPYCGLRDQIEFANGGEAHRVRPSATTATTDEEWAEFLFMRTNPKGALAERWIHAAGCRRWFNMLRNTATDEILVVYPIGAERPQVDIAPLGTPSGEADIGSGNDAAKIEHRAGAGAKGGAA